MTEQRVFENYEKTRVTESYSGFFDLVDRSRRSAATLNKEVAEMAIDLVGASPGKLIKPFEQGTLNPNIPLEVSARFSDRAAN